MTEPLVHLEDLSLRYRLASQQIGTFKGYLIHLIRGSLTYKDLWALQNVNLQIAEGEVVGIVGPNGAGKSTLAKVVSGVLKPTTGKRSVRGRVAPILELGTGFDVELTGHENIYLNALFLGRKRSEINEQLDSIIEFSGLGDFIHSPLRNYSTGMVARLAFAIATAWVAEILVFDEVLAVGDFKFLARCGERIRQIREQGATILLVTHSAQHILDYCDRCLWLQEGTIQKDGAPQEVLDLYLASSSDAVGEAKIRSTRDLDLPEMAGAPS